MEERGADAGVHLASADRDDSRGEDVLRGMAMAKFGGGGRSACGKMKVSVHKVHKSTKEQHLKASVAIKMGLQVVSKILVPAGHEGMTA